MALNLEVLINENEYLKETLEESIKIRKQKEAKTLEKVEISKKKRLEEIEKPYNKRRVQLGKMVYKPLRLLMTANTKMSGVKNTILNDYKHINDGKPIMYLATHMCKYDIEIVMELIKQHAHLLSGTEDRMLESLEGTLLGLNGVNYVDRKDPVDRNLAIKKIDKDLKNGVNVLVFPEGTWNIDQNQLLLPISYSVIEKAIINDAPIEMVAFDQEGKEIITNFGGRLNIDKYRNSIKKIDETIKNIEATLLNENNKEKLVLVKEEITLLQKERKNQLIELANIVRDALATLKWETMVYKEEYLQTNIKPKEYNQKELVRNNPNMDYNYYTKREDIPETYWGDAVADMVKEWFMTDLLEESEYIYKPRDEAHKFFEEFNSRETYKNNKLVKERISSEGKSKKI